MPTLCSMKKLRTTPGRSAIMSRIRSKDTAPEMLVRRILFHMGYRFRLHARKLPGCPDVVLTKYRTILQIKGCFWHGHACDNGRMPRANRHYWIPKLRRNKVSNRVIHGKPGQVARDRVTTPARQHRAVRGPRVIWRSENRGARALIDQLTHYHRMRSIDPPYPGALRWFRHSHHGETDLL
jgi:DNA mismatch endonuclease (patch repair protein)